MRIKQKKLNIPAYAYVRMVNGVQAIVQVFTEPQKCVNIIQIKGTQKVQHCYPIDDAQFEHYVYEAKDWNSPNYQRTYTQYKDAVLMYNKFNDVNLKIFYKNVAQCYANKLGIISELEV